MPPDTSRSCMVNLHKQKQRREDPEQKILYFYCQKVMAVSYTHLDVYKRQRLICMIDLCRLLLCLFQNSFCVMQVIKTFNLCNIPCTGESCICLLYTSRSAPSLSTYGHSPLKYRPAYITPRVYQYTALLFHFLIHVHQSYRAYWL